MKTKTFLILVISLISFNLSAQETQTIIDKGKYLSIEIPSHWVSATDKNMFISTIACSDTINTNEKLTVNCSKATGNLKETYSLNKKAFMDAGLIDFAIKEEGNITLDNEAAQWFIYTFSNNDKTVKMIGKIYVMKKSGRAITLQFITHEDRFNLAKEAFEKIIMSLHVK
jgi:hypothetical protein